MGRPPNINGRYLLLTKTLCHFFMSLSLLGIFSVEKLQPAQAEAPKSSSNCQSPGFPRLIFDQSHVFPQDRSLARPEDGKALPDGPLIVADERYGLLLIEQDGINRAFGHFKEAGYVHNPPHFPGAPNGVFLEHDSLHILVVEVYTGKIFRVNTHTEETRLIYDHPYGVNSIYRDQQGTLWFTQSTNNPEENGKDGLWAAANVSLPTGAIFKLEGSGDEFVTEAKEIVDNLYMANGITMDNTEHFLYVSESMMDRVLRFRVDVKSGTLSERETYQLLPIPDNLAIDTDNNLWIASPMAYQVSVVDQDCRSLHKVFHSGTEKSEALWDEWVKRSHLGQPRLDLVGVEKDNPLPGYVTGLFFSPNQDTVYFTGLGNALLKFKMPQD